MIKNFIPDFLTRIRNSYIKKHKFSYIVYNKHILQIVKTLIRQGYISKYIYCRKSLFLPVKTLKLFLGYSGQWVKYPTINHLKSKHEDILLPYLTYKYIIKNKNLCNSSENFIISTTSGIMTIKNAIKLQKGGKFLFYIK